MSCVNRCGGLSVHKLEPHSLVERDGRIKPDDCIVRINGQDLVDRDFTGWDFIGFIFPSENYHINRSLLFINSIVLQNLGNYIGLNILFRITQSLFSFFLCNTTVISVHLYKMFYSFIIAQ